MSVQEQFQVLAQTTLEEAEAVNCTIPEFIEGLGTIITTLEDSRAAALECHKATGQ